MVGAEVAGMKAVSREGAKLFQKLTWFYGQTAYSAASAELHKGTKISYLVE